MDLPLRKMVLVMGGVLLILVPAMLYFMQVGVLDSSQSAMVSSSPKWAVPTKWQIPSARSRGGERTVSIILNWFRRRDAAEQLIEAMNAGDEVASVWVCAFNSPLESYYRELINSFKQQMPASHPIKLEFISSSFNFKYHGRFLLGLMAPSSVVWYVDDDMSWNRALLPTLLDALGAHKGIISLRGHRLNRKRRPPLSEQQYAPVWADSVAGVEHSKNMPQGWVQGRKGSLAFEVDYGCNSWLLEKRWLWALVHEPVPGFSTGEDIQLSYAVRKYYGVGTFVLRIGDETGDGAQMSARAKHMELRGTQHTGPAQHDIRFSMFLQLIGRGAQLLERPSSLQSLALVGNLREAQIMLELVRTPTSKQRFGGTALVYQSRATEQEALAKVADHLCSITDCGFNICQFYGGCAEIKKFDMGIPQLNALHPSDNSGYVRASLSGIFSFTTPRRLLLYKSGNSDLKEVAIELAGKFQIEVVSV